MEEIINNAETTEEEQINQPLEKICPYCQARIEPGESLVHCSQCGVPHHEECWKENGGCTVYGCKGWAVWPGLNLSQLEDRTIERVDFSKLKTRELVLTCPMCKSRISKGMAQCYTCGYDLPGWMLGRYVINIPWYLMIFFGLLAAGGIGYGVLFFMNY